MTDEERIKWIDEASVEALWRFGRTGDPFFLGAVGEYYGKALAAKRHADEAAYVAASKRIGWDK